MNSFQYGFFDELGKLAAEHQPIDWDTHHGKAFRWAVTPEEARRDASGNPIKSDGPTYSLVTPENNAAWTDWKPAPDDYVANMKKNWPQISKQLADYKRDQIVRSINSGAGS